MNTVSVSSNEALDYPVSACRLPVFVIRAADLIEPDHACKMAARLFARYPHAQESVSALKPENTLLAFRGGDLLGAALMATFTQTAATGRRLNKVALAPQVHRKEVTGALLRYTA